MLFFKHPVPSALNDTKIIVLRDRSALCHAKLPDNMEFVQATHQRLIFKQVLICLLC